MFICIQPFKINFSLKCQHKSPHSINPPVDKPPEIAYLKMVLPFMALNCNILDVVGKRGRQRALGGWVGSPNESTLTLQPILQQCCLAKFSPGSAELSRSKLTERTPQPSSSALAVATRFAQHLIYSEPEKANRGFSRKMLLPSRDSWFSFRRIPLSVIFFYFREVGSQRKVDFIGNNVASLQYESGILCWNLSNLSNSSLNIQ